MTKDEARALFDVAHDRELDGEQQRAFDELLASDPALRDEYARFETLLKSADDLGGLPPVDLLAGVQAKLRARSGGRFYRDRFAESRGRTAAITWVLLLSTLVLVAAALWLAIAQFGGVTPH